MASIALRSLRMSSRLPKFGFRKPRIFFTESSSSNPLAKFPGVASYTLSFVPYMPPPYEPPPLPKPPGKERKALKFLSNGLIWAFTAISSAAGYASYVPVKAIEMYLGLREVVEEHVKGFTEPLSEKLLPDLHPSEQNAFTLVVLDLNETLLYTDWKRDRGWRTFKRPGVDVFLEHLANFIVYSDQMDMYVYPVCEKLDPNGYIRFRLARGATKYENGKHYRDLSKLNRDPKRILYVSGNAFESSLQQENCVPIKPYKLEADDTALVDLIPFLECESKNNRDKADDSGGVKHFL